jgi:hypothetical protein
MAQSTTRTNNTKPLPWFEVRLQNRSPDSNARASKRSGSEKRHLVRNPTGLFRINNKIFLKRAVPFRAHHRALVLAVMSVVLRSSAVVAFATAVERLSRHYPVTDVEPSHGITFGNHDTSAFMGPCDRQSAIESTILVF